ncbi:hemerythrin domain-containing protein [Noviherbaspirillum sp.]|uniref:hemerythrin domain-containing protein n=1 Tax=Noviherbaspirillum sp. TaxID=1926288 RepID=UPI002FDFB675
MEMDVNDRRGGAGFPVDQPLQALRMDHQLVRKLFDSYLGSQDMNVRKEAGRQILMNLELHDALEQTVFYPRVHEADASLVDSCEEDHQQVRQMIDQLKAMDDNDPQCEQMYRQLSEAVMQHVEVEEQQLFPKVEQANMDMSALGLEMQAFEANMVSGQASAIGQKDARS